MGERGTRKQFTLLLAVGPACYLSPKLVLPVGKGWQRRVGEPRVEEVREVVAVEFFGKVDEISDRRRTTTETIEPRAKDREEHVIAYLQSQRMQGEGAAAVHACVEESCWAGVSGRRRLRDSRPIEQSNFESIEVAIPSELDPKVFGVACESFVEPDVLPGGWAHVVAEPLVRNLMGHDRSIDPSPSTNEPLKMLRPCVSSAKLKLPSITMTPYSSKLSLIHI